MSLLGSRWVGVAARSGLAAALGLVDPDHNARDAPLPGYASSVLGDGAVPLSNFPTHQTKADLGCCLLLDK